MVSGAGREGLYIGGGGKVGRGKKWGGEKKWEGGILFLIQLGKVRKAGRGWLPSGATKGV